MGKTFGYCRYSLDRPGAVSLDDADAQEKDSIKVQQEAIEAYRQAVLPKEQFVDFYVDARTSATIPFLDREAGGRLDKMLCKGDHIVMLRLDRGFRSVKDLAITTEIWQRRGVSLHVINLGLNTGSSTGKLVIQILAVVAEFERELLVERLREAMIRKSREFWAKGWRQGVAPLGYKLVKATHHADSHQVYAPDWKEREVCQQIKKWFDQGCSVLDIVIHLEKHKVITKYGRPWGKDRVKKALAMIPVFEKEEEELGLHRANVKLVHPKPNGQPAEAPEASDPLGTEEGNSLPPGLGIPQALRRRHIP